MGWQVGSPIRDRVWLRGWQVGWTNLEGKWMENSHGDRLAAIHGESLLQDPVRNYDATIYVLRSGIEVMRPLKLGTR